MMHTPLLGLTLEVAWADSDVIQLRAAAWNGRFGGATDVYIALDEPHQTADTLRGFPTSPADVREFKFGALGQDSRFGGLHCRFFCADGAGHSYVDIQIDSGEYKNQQVRQRAQFRMPVEASDIDTFVTELRALGQTLRAKARLLSIE